MNGKDMGKLGNVDTGMAELQQRIAEQRAKRAAAEADLAALKEEWATLCRRVDVDGEKGLQADISANEARQATARRTIERVDVVLPELQARLDAAQKERGRILYAHNAAELDKLNKLDTPLLKRYIAAARTLLAVVDDVNAHEAAKSALVNEANDMAHVTGLPSLSLRRLPLFDVNTQDVGGADKRGSLEWFLREEVAPRWPEPIL